MSMALVKIDFCAGYYRLVAINVDVWFLQRFHRSAVYLALEQSQLDSVPPLLFNYTRENSESSQEVKIPINNVLAKYVKVRQC